MAEENVAQATSAAQPESAEPSVDRPDVVMEEVKAEVAENGSNGTEGASISAAQADVDANEKDNELSSKGEFAHLTMALSTNRWLIKTSLCLENSAPPPKQETEGAENKATTSSEGEEKNEDNANTEDGDTGSAQGAADTSAKSKSRRKSGGNLRHIHHLATLANIA